MPNSNSISMAGRTCMIFFHIPLEYLWDTLYRWQYNFNTSYINEYRINLYRRRNNFNIACTDNATILGDILEN